MLISIPSVWLALAAAQSLEIERTPPISPGRYCLVEPVVGYTGTGPDIPLGNFLMQAEVVRTGSGYKVSIWNVMPDSQQVLIVETSRARISHDGSLNFRFTDDWGNRGRARIYVNARVDLVMTQKAPANQISRNYGSYQLSADGCFRKEFPAA